jgi:hypothetical protein
VQQVSVSVSVSSVAARELGELPDYEDFAMERVSTGVVH